jgi:rubrerythrin
MLTFNADELFEIAENIERNGARFYQAAASLAGAAKVKEVLQGLADMELQHERTFASMRAELSEEQKAPLTFDPDHQAAQYLQTLAEGKVFDLKSDPTRRLTGKESVEEVIRLAVALEKDTIVFYLGMRDLVPRRAGQAKLDDIIREEMQHIVVLTGQLPKTRQ